MSSPDRTQFDIDLTKSVLEFLETRKTDEAFINAKRGKKGGTQYLDVHAAIWKHWGLSDEDALTTKQERRVENLIMKFNEARDAEKAAATKKPVKALGVKPISKGVDRCGLYFEQLPPAPEGRVWVLGIEGLWQCALAPATVTLRLKLDKDLVNLTKECAAAGYNETEGTGTIAHEATHILENTPAYLRRTIAEYLRNAISGSEPVISDGSVEGPEWDQGVHNALSFVDALLEELSK